jgi:hypothetical protein
LRRKRGRRRRVKKNSRVGSRGPLTEIVQKNLSKLPVLDSGEVRGREEERGEEGGI